MLIAPFAISRIVQRFALPGSAGLLLLALGIWQDIGWAKVAGVILAAPILWAYAVLIFGYVPCLIVDGIRRRLNKSS